MMKFRCLMYNSSFAVKYADPLISEVLEKLFDLFVTVPIKNMAFSNKTVPVYKSGTVYDHKNYRPNSMAFGLQKLCESSNS